MRRNKSTESCPRCASRDIMLQDSSEDGPDLYVCFDCDHEFKMAAPYLMHPAGDQDLEDDSDIDYLEEEWNY